ncbi:hypothetical protein [Anaeromyxobacter diazotrophicus]|uniref:Uncharacterized protein n=1 Tax=Anaeromyxobacter diazotrophicus TaxID=2590199 RepID=A0A7I9VPS8_9BACT|nr:hypothetical protein [Anaeromyxobacter diazotrophicus]GEJ58412.1 hypothetical protein AMYX_31530 [Anaeromyxobacter diazotrophicus]
MATKAEEHRYWTERSGPKKAKSPPRPRRDVGVDTAKPGVSATDRKAGPRKASPKAAKKAAYALERSEGRPSRRSTRRAANRQRTDSQMRVKQRTTGMRPSQAGV